MKDDLRRLIMLSVLRDAEPHGGGGTAEADNTTASEGDGGNFEHLESDDADDPAEWDPESDGPTPTDAPTPEPPAGQVETPSDSGPESFSPPDQVGRLLDLLGGRASAPPPQQGPPQGYPPQQMHPQAPMQQGPAPDPEPPLPEEHLWDTNPGKAQQMLVEHQRWGQRQMESRFNQRIAAQEQHREMERRAHITDNVMRMEAQARKAYEEVFKKSPACRDQKVWDQVNAYMQDRLVRAATMAFQQGDLRPAQAMQNPEYYKAILRHAIAEASDDSILDRPPLRTRGGTRAAATGPDTSPGIGSEYEEARENANREFKKLGINISRERLRRAKERVARGIIDE